MTEWKEGYDHSFGAIINNKLYTAPVKIRIIQIIDLYDKEIYRNITLPSKVWMSKNQYLYSYWYTRTFENKLFICLMKHMVLLW